MSTPRTPGNDVLLPITSFVTNKNTLNCQIKDFGLKPLWGPFKSTKLVLDDFNFEPKPNILSPYAGVFGRMSIFFTPNNHKYHLLINIAVNSSIALTFLLCLASGLMYFFALLILPMAIFYYFWSEAQEKIHDLMFVYTPNFIVIYRGKGSDYVKDLKPEFLCTYRETFITLEKKHFRIDDMNRKRGAFHDCAWTVSLSIWNKPKNKYKEFYTPLLNTHKETQLICSDEQFHHIFWIKQAYFENEPEAPCPQELINDVKEFMEGKLSELLGFAVGVTACEYFDDKHETYFITILEQGTVGQIVFNNETLRPRFVHEGEETEIVYKN